MIPGNKNSVILVSHGKIQGRIPNGIFIKRKEYIYPRSGVPLPVPQNKVVAAIRARRDIQAPDRRQRTKPVGPAQIHAGLYGKHKAGEEKMSYES
jgi:hypothetical protein